jgi:hypothetical protein
MVLRHAPASNGPNLDDEMLLMMMTQSLLSLAPPLPPLPLRLLFEWDKYGWQLRVRVYDRSGGQLVPGRMGIECNERHARLCTRQSQSMGCETYGR